MIARINFLANTIQASHQQSCKQQIWIRAGVWRAELDTLCWCRVCLGDTDSRTTVALREDQVNGCFVARNETLVAIRRGCSNSEQGWGMHENAANVVACQL